MTSRTPGLDPDLERVVGVADRLAAAYYMSDLATILAADDAHARSRGLVATGDALTREAVAGLVRFVGSWHSLSCQPGERGKNCGPCALLAALPSSLLDNPPGERDA